MPMTDFYHCYWCESGIYSDSKVHVTLIWLCGPVETSVGFLVKWLFCKTLLICIIRYSSIHFLCEWLSPSEMQEFYSDRFLNFFILVKASRGHQQTNLLNRLFQFTPRLLCNAALGRRCRYRDGMIGYSKSVFFFVNAQKTSISIYYQNNKGTPYTNVLGLVTNKRFTKHQKDNTREVGHTNYLPQ